VALWCASLLVCGWWGEIGGSGRQQCVPMRVEVVPGVCSIPGAELVGGRLWLWVQLVCAGC
jgi:hypothetical protein